MVTETTEDAEEGEGDTNLGNYSTAGFPTTAQVPIPAYDIAQAAPVPVYDMTTQSGIDISSYPPLEEAATEPSPQHTQAYVPEAEPISYVQPTRGSRESTRTN